MGAAFSALLAIPALVAIVCLVPSVFLWVKGEPGIYAIASLGIIGGWFVAILASMYAFPAGRSLLTPTYWEASLRRRPPILLLRSFVDDGRGTPFDYGTDANKNFSRAVGESFRKTMPVGGLSAGVGYWVAKSTLRMMHMSETFEEALVTYLKPYGPVVTIAKPGERWKPAGAARLVVKGAGEEWKEVVTDLIQKSSLVLMIVGKTPGVTWEITEVISRGTADKLWLFFPPGEPGDVTERWGLFREQLLAAGVTNTPETLSLRQYLLAAGIKKVSETDRVDPLCVRFDKTWTCHPRWPVHERESYMRLVKELAEEFFSKRGIRLLSTRVRPFLEKAFKVFAWTFMAICLLVLLYAMTRSRR